MKTVQFFIHSFRLHAGREESNSNYVIMADIGKLCNKMIMTSIHNFDPEYDTSQEWYDYNLKWNPDKFGGIRELRLPPYRIWKPDLLMLNR